MRERFIPNNPSATHTVWNKVIYEYEKDGKLLAICYSGKSKKSYWHYNYPSNEARKKSIEENLAHYRKEEQWEKERDAKRKIAYEEFRKNLKVGSIFSYSWGYDQTNYQFYEVTGFQGKNTVLLRELNQSRGPEDGFMTALTEPIPGSYKEQEFKKRFKQNNDYIEMDFGIARIWSGKKERITWYA
jgi:hypothetical protein